MILGMSLYYLSFVQQYFIRIFRSILHYQHTVPDKDGNHVEIIVPRNDIYKNHGKYQNDMSPADIMG